MATKKKKRSEAPATPVVTTAALLKRVLRTEPEPVTFNGKTVFLHRVASMDDIVLMAELRDIRDRLLNNGVSQKQVDQACGQAAIFGIIQLSLREGRISDAPRVFSSFDEAYANLKTLTPELLEIHRRYNECFDLTEVEKKS